jgi:hypothetical protein
VGTSSKSKKAANKRVLSDDGNYEYETATMSSNAPESSSTPVASGKIVKSSFGGGAAKMGGFSMKAHLPQVKLNVPLGLSSSEVFEVFSLVSKSTRFQVIEMESNIATAVNKEPFSLKRMFLRCIPFSSESKKEQPTDSLISAVRLQISVNEAKCCRKITVKGLYGDNARLSEFTELFKSRITDRVSILPEDH